MVAKERDEELLLFLEIRRREKENAKTEPLQNSDASLGPNAGGFSPLLDLLSAMPPRKTGYDNFLNSENNKSDYEWLLTPPARTLLSSLEKESLMNQIAVPNSRPTALKPRLENLIEEPASKGTLVPKRLTSLSRQFSSDTSNGCPSSTGEPKSSSRSATPGGRSTLTAAVKPARSSTPTSRGTLPSAASTKPGASTARTSTPTRSTSRSSTPTSRSSATISKSISRSATPRLQPVSRRASAAPVLPSSSIKVVQSAMSSPALARSVSPTVKSYTPDISLYSPPNLRTATPKRPTSASRGRPGAQIVRSSVVELGYRGRLKRQSCSPRGMALTGNAHGIWSSNHSISRTDVNSRDSETPVVIGIKMVQRMVNIRKLASRKQDDKCCGHNNPPEKPSFDASGFGRTLSKASLDMALRHMDIKRIISGNIPASMVNCARTGSKNGRTTGVSDSPITANNQAISGPSANKNPVGVDGRGFGENDVGNERGNSSPASKHEG